MGKLLVSTMLAIGTLFFGQACAQGQTSTETASLSAYNETSQNLGPGYLFVSGWYKDASVQKAYIEKVGPVIREHGFVSVKIGVPGVSLNVLEGDWTSRGTSLMRFESEKAVKQFWHSPAYQNDVKPIRHENSALDVIKLGAAFGTQPTMDSESALLVFFVDLTDRDKLLAEYVPKAPAIVAEYGGKFLVSSARWNMELLEGDFPSESIVIVEFPTQSKLTEFWNDERYKALSEIRKTTGKWSVVEIIPFSPNNGN